MSFTDDDLKRLKEKIKLTGDEEDHFVWVDKIEALLARLEAAEDYCEIQGPSTDMAEKKHLAWRKEAAGKESK